MFVAAVVILAGVVVVASGRGGEMVATEPDYPPIDLGPVTSADVALLRPPSAAWGYNMRVTDEALEVIAKAVTERDVQIAALEQEVSDLRDQLGGGGRTATLDRPGGDPEPAGPPLPEPDWPGGAEDTTAAGPAVPITRPQPIYHAEDQGAAAGQGTDEVHLGSGPGSGSGDDQSEAPAEASAPWGPAEPPEHEPLWEPSHQPAAEAVHEPEPEPHAGWSADPADTSPDATPVDPGGETSVPVTPATGWRAQAPDQGGAPVQGPARPGRRRGHPEFHWDEDPHQRVVWGAEHARAKAARATEETLPNAEHPDGDRD
jgi:hypothetical protein